MAQDTVTATPDFVKIMADYHSGDPKRVQSAKERACIGLDSLIRSVIRDKFPTYAHNYEDLMQEGRLAIISEMDRYDPSKGAPTTFFYTSICHYLQANVVVDQQGLTRYYSEVATKIKRAEDALTSLTGKTEHDDIAICNYTKLSLATVQKTRRLLQTTPNGLSFDESTAAITSRARDEDTPELALLESEQSGIIEDALNTLTDSERLIISRMYGMDGMKPDSTLKKVANNLGIEYDTAKRHYMDGIRKLKTNPALCKYYGKPVKKRKAPRGETVITGTISISLTPPKRMSASLYFGNEA